MNLRCCFTALGAGLVFLSARPLPAAEWKFSFNSKRPIPGSTPVASDMAFDEKKGFGYVRHEGVVKIFGVKVEE
ncbi:MAG TPA: hypothetical protein VK956_19675, partial [Verrucomicrobium sp.]|nr:hypothetical protein [Verrucomicrobium sp.]